MPRTLILREGGPSQLIELPRAVADALAASGVVQILMTDRLGWWEVTAGTQVGVVQVGGQQIVIQPKLEFRRLVFLMGYARNPSFWHDDRVRLDPEADLPEALADAFVRVASRALDQGLLKGYRTVEETLPVLRGRVREADQLRRRWGRSMPLEVRYDDFSVDIPENQILLAAALRLLRLPGVGPMHRTRLQRLRLQLADVIPPVGKVPPSCAPSRLNTRYQPGLELAELILRGRSFEHRVGDVVMTGYLFNMYTIFEDFVTVALGEALKPYGGRSVLQYRTFLDEDDRIEIRPDFVWLKDGQPQIVADAKYKAEKPAGFPQADLYQMLAYCTALGLPEGHLIYAKGNEFGQRHTVRRSGVTMVTHTLDPNLAPTALVAAVHALVAVVVAAAPHG